MTQKFFWPKNYFDQKFFLLKIFRIPNFFGPKIFNYIFNYKNSLTTNQMGFDTIEINLVSPNFYSHMLQSAPSSFHVRCPLPILYIWIHFYVLCPHPILNIWAHCNAQYPHPILNIWTYFYIIKFEHKFCHTRLHLVNSVVILAQLVSSSVALPAELVYRYFFKTGNFP